MLLSEQGKDKQNEYKRFELKSVYRDILIVRVCEVPMKDCDKLTFDNS